MLDFFCTMCLYFAEDDIVYMPLRTDKVSFRVMAVRS